MDQPIHLNMFLVMWVADSVVGHSTNHHKSFLVHFHNISETQFPCRSTQPVHMPIQFYSTLVEIAHTDPLGILFIRGSYWLNDVILCFGPQVLSLNLISYSMHRRDLKAWEICPSSSIVGCKVSFDWAYPCNRVLWLPLKVSHSPAIYWKKISSMTFLPIQRCVFLLSVNLAHTTGQFWKPLYSMLYI